MGASNIILLMTVLLFYTGAFIAGVSFGKQTRTCRSANSLWDIPIRQDVTITGSDRSDKSWDIPMQQNVVKPLQESMRTAVCISGQLRVFNMTSNHKLYPDRWQMKLPGPPPAVELQNMTVAQSMVKNLYPYLGDFDVFVTVGTRRSLCRALSRRFGSV
jgi:hypothetical protein